MARSQVHGIPELRSVLRKLPATMQQKSIDTALRAGARLIAKRAKQLVRRRTGALAESITVGKAKRGEARGHIVVGYRSPTSRRAHFEEYGTSRQAARPHMRPALSSEGPAAIKKIGEALGKAIERNARKLAGRLTSKQRRRIFK